MSDEYEEVPVIELRGAKVAPKGPKFNEGYDNIEWDTYVCIFCGCDPCQCKVWEE